MVLQAKFVVMDTAVQLLVLVSMTLVVKEVATTVTIVMVVTKARTEVLVVRLVASLAQAPGVLWVPPVWWTPPRRLPSQILLPARRTCCKSFMP